MTTGISFRLLPRHVCALAALAAAAAAGAAYPILREMKPLTQGILVVGAIGLGIFLVMPSRRIALVCAWVLVFPLSLEKVFPVFHPTYAGFFMQPLVLSGSDLVLAFLLVTLFWEAASEHRLPFRWHDAAVPYLGLVGWAFVSFAIHRPSSEGIEQLMHWCKMAVFLAAMSSAIRTRAELLSVVTAAGAAAFIQAGLVCYSFVTHRHFGFSPKAADAQLLSIAAGSTEIIRATGTLGHPNQQAMYQVFFTIPVAALLMVRNWLWRLFIGSMFAVSAVAIIATFSRTAWISCATAAGLAFALALLSGRVTRRAWLALSAGALALIVIAAVFSGPIVNRLTKGDDGASLSRIHLALLSLEHVEHHPIAGVGPGNFVNARLDTSEGPFWVPTVWLRPGLTYGNYYIGDLELGLVQMENRYYFTSLPAHNKYLLVAAELGLVGLGLFLWYQWRIWTALRRGLAAAEGLLWWIGAALVGTFAATLIEYMLELFYDDKTVLMPLFANVLVICFSRIAIAEAGKGIA